MTMEFGEIPEKEDKKGVSAGMWHLISILLHVQTDKRQKVHYIQKKEKKKKKKP